MDEVSQLSLRNLRRVIQLRWRLVATVSLLVFAAAAAFIFSLAPAYRADAVVLLAPPTEELGSAPAKERNSAMTDPFYVRSETAIVGSDDVSRAVITKLKLAQHPDFAPRPGLRERLGLPARAASNRFLSPDEVRVDMVLRQYQDQLSIFNDGRSNTVEVGFSASDPRLAAEIANAHAQAYLEAQSSRRSGTQQQALEWLKREVDERAKDVRDADALVQQYQLRHGIVSTRDETLVGQRLVQLNSQLIEAKRQLSTQVALLGELRHVRRIGEPANAASLIANQLPIVDLLRSRAQAEADVASLSARLAPTHPTLVKRREELASLRQVLDQQLRRAESETESSVGWWQRQVNDLTANVSAETSNKVSQDKVVAGLPSLTAQAQVKRSVFEAVLSRYQLLLAENGFSSPTASIVSRAVPPALPWFPKTSVFLVIAGMAAAFCGIACALVVQLMRPGLKGLAAISEAAGIPALATIPRFRRATRPGGVVEMEDPRLFIESIRSVRNAVLGQRGSRPTTTCLLTSVLPGQGKSLVAMSLARSIARTGARTIFVELDLRCPSASALARTKSPKKGVAAVLDDHSLLREVVLRDESTSLDMLLAERHSSRALDRLTPPSLAALLETLREEYEAIVIDSPPVGLVSDAFTLATLADQTLLIAKERESSIPELARHARMLKERGATVTGLILTDVEPSEMSNVRTELMHRYAVGLPPQPDQRERAPVPPPRRLPRPA